MFLARGYDGVSLDEIVRAAGGSKTNIYGFFGGKEGLFLAVMEDVCAGLLAPLHALDLDGADLGPGLDALGRTLLDELLTPRHLALYRLVAADPGRCGALARLWYAHGPAAAHDCIAGFLARHEAEGRLAGLGAHQAAVLFHDMVTGDPINRALAGEVPDAGARAQAVAQAVRLLAGERAREPAPHPGSAEAEPMRRAGIQG